MVDDTTDDDSVTSNPQVRWTYLGSSLAIVVIVVFMAITAAAALGYADTSAIDSTWFYLVWIVVLAAASWVFGIDLLKEYSNYKQ